MRTVSTAYSGMPSARSTIGANGCFGQPGDQAGEQLAHVRVGQRLEIDRREAALAGTPVRALLEQLRTREGDDVDGRVARPLEQVVDEVEQARIGEVHVLEDQRHGALLGDALEERAPGTEQLLRRGARFDAQQRQQRRLDPGALLGVSYPLLDGCVDLRLRRQLVVALDEAAARADHLARAPRR